MPNEKKKPTEEMTEAAAPATAPANPDRHKKHMIAAEKAHDDSLAAYNAALAIQNVDAMREAEEAIAKAEKEFAEAAECDVFAICKAEEHPLRKAAELHSYRVIGHRSVNEDKVLVCYEKVSREKQIDLAKLAKKCGLPTLWVHDVEGLNKVLTLLVAQEKGYTTAQLKAVAESFLMTRKVEEIEIGKTPTSNTQLVKMLQSICDKILGGGVVHVNNHDISYIRDGHTKKGRERISISVANHAAMRNLVYDVLYRRLTGQRYGVEHQKLKGM